MACQPKTIRAWHLRTVHDAMRAATRPRALPALERVSVGVRRAAVRLGKEPGSSTRCI